jgi:serine protease AprX
MKLNKLWTLSLFLFASHLAFGQYAQVFFDKKETLHQDYFNSPVSEHYQNAIRQEGVTILKTSKWLNAVLIPKSDVAKIQHFTFITHISETAALRTTTHSITDESVYGASDWQLDMLGLRDYHQLGYTGKGVTIGVFDGGFRFVDSLPLFDSLRTTNRLKAAYDFVRNDSLNYRESAHGMQVLSLMGGYYPDSLLGAAYDASFVLARTEEVRSETHQEEWNWVNAMEWADSFGVDIIHSSLGYSLFDSLQGDYTYADMDGSSTIITLAAELAASRGIFITNSAGNSGNKPWRYITAPCDGKNVLCVGAVDSSETLADFSSRGPSSDGRIKPEVVAMGRRTTIPNQFGVMHRGNGTSFSGPLVAGLVACLKEAHPERSNAAIRQAILQSADRYTNPDNDYGYGIPNALKADSILRALTNTKKKPGSTLELKIFPNPATENIRIVCTPNSNLTVVNVAGKTVMQQMLNNWYNFVNVKDLTSGVYWFTVITQEGNVQRQKVVLQ